MEAQKSQRLKAWRKGGTDGDGDDTGRESGGQGRGGNGRH